MKKSRIMWPVAAAALVLMLGVLTGLAAAAASTRGARSSRPPSSRNVDDAQSQFRWEHNLTAVACRTLLPACVMVPDR